MKRFGCGLVASLALLALAGCESVRLFADYEVVESPEVADAPWPRLVEVPAAPPPGRYGPGVPDPATGIAVETALGLGARQAEGRLGGAGAPVLRPEDRAAFEAREAERARRPAPAGAPLSPAERRALDEGQARARARRADGGSGGGS